MPHFDRLILCFDGASKNNPHGPAGHGWTIHIMNAHGAKAKMIGSGWKYLGYKVSNNQAEYAGLLAALECLHINEISCRRLYIRGDSEIVINQLNGFYKVRSPNIIPYHKAVMKTIHKVDCYFIKFTHIDRSQNYEADSNAQYAIRHRCQ